MESTNKEVIQAALRLRDTGSERWLTNRILFEIAKELEAIKDAIRQH